MPIAALFGFIHASGPHTAASNRPLQWVHSTIETGGQPFFVIPSAVEESLII